MGQQHSQTVALMGDVEELAAKQAALLLAALRDLAKTEPPMNVKEAADFLKISPDQVRELAERGLIPAFNAALPGSTVRHWRFFKHQLASVGVI